MLDVRFLKSYSSALVGGGRSIRLPFRRVAREMEEHRLKIEKNPQRADRASNSTR